MEYRNESAFERGQRDAVGEVISSGEGGRLLPIISIEAAILDCLGKVFRADPLRLIEVGDRAGDFQNAVVSARGQAEAADRHFESPLAGVVESAQRAQPANRDLRVVISAALLNGAGTFHPMPDFGRGFAFVFPAQLAIWNRGDLDMKVDSIEQRSTDSPQIPLN